jgi:integrase
VKKKLAEVGGRLQTGLPKSEAGKRTVAIPDAIIVDLRTHLAKWSEAGANGRVFVGPKGATPKRSNMNRYWKKAVKRAGVDVDPDVGLHFHDLRHLGNDLRSPGASLKDLMAHMGQSTQRAALIYQHANTQRQKAMAALVSDAIWHVHGTTSSEHNDGVTAQRSETQSDEGIEVEHPQRDSNPCRHLERVVS